MNRMMLRMSRRRVAQDPHAITLRIKKKGLTNAGDTFDEYTLGTDFPAYVKKLTTEDILATDNAAVVAKSKIWQLWLECLENAVAVGSAVLPVPPPKIGDIVLDDEGVSWIIWRIIKKMQGECFNCLAGRSTG